MTDKKKKEEHFCYYCGEKIAEDDLVKKKIPLHGRSGIRMYTRKFHRDCLKEYLVKNNDEEKLLAETDDWAEVYEYFKHQILNLDEGKNLSPHAVNRLQGLRVGQYMRSATNTRALKRGYPYKVILNTLRYSKRNIDYAVKHKNFKSEKHKIDYIMVIVQNNINFIQKRMDDLAHQREKVEKLKKEEVTTTQGAAYKRKGTGRRKVVLC